MKEETKEANSSVRSDRIRRAVNSLSPNERQQYFTCLKMLAILPPIPGNKAEYGAPSFEDWDFPSVTSSQENPQMIKPKNLHDVLISSHSTGCEHRTFYFNHYHRHLTMLAEIFLNFAHNLLVTGNSEGEALQNLKRVYKDKPALYEGFEPEWLKVLSRYRQIVNDKNAAVNLHYWAPTNYQSKTDLTVLKQININYTIFSKEPIDELFRKVCKCHPGEINVAEKWFNTQGDYDKSRNQLIEMLNRGAKSKELNTNSIYVGYNGRIIQDFQDDYKDEFIITPEMKDSQYQQKFDAIRQGIITPRNNFKNVYSILNPPAYKKSQGKLLDVYIYETMFTQQKNWDKLDLDNPRYVVNNIQDNHSIAKYGGFDFCYLTSQQQQEYNSKVEDSDKMFSDQRITYNQSLPHYQYARAYYTVNTIPQFFLRSKTIDIGLQISHNAMHNNLNSIFSNAQFSITSLLFFPYHSWIDAMLQFYIRKMNSQPPNNKITLEKYLKEFKRKSNFITSQNMKRGKLGILGELAKQKKVLNGNLLQINGNFKELLTKLGINTKNQQLAGYYPIVEYLYDDDANKNNILSSAFSALDYMLNQDKKTIRSCKTIASIYQNYIFSERFKQYFQNFQAFPFNYDYQIEGDLMNEEGQNLPAHLQKIKDTILKDQPRDAADRLERAIKLSKPFLEKIPKKMLAQQKLQLSKLFSLRNMVYLKYPSSLKNGAYPITFIFKNIQEKEYSNSRNVFKILKNGLNVGFVSVFGRQKNASACPKCLAYKELFANFDDNIESKSLQLWQKVHLFSLNPLLYDSESEVKLNCTAQKWSVLKPNGFAQARLVTGAQQINVDVVFTGKEEANQYIRLDAFVFSVANGDNKSIVSQKKLTLNTSFQFMQIHDVNQESDTAQFDSYAYQRLKGEIIVDQWKNEFDIGIPCFQRLLRLKVVIKLENNVLKVQVEDKDYQLKMFFYRRANN